MITREPPQRFIPRQPMMRRRLPGTSRQWIFSPILPVCLVLSLGLTSSCYAQARVSAVADEPQEPKYRGEVELLLDKEEWSQTEPITGTILFRLLPVANVPEGKQTVRLKGPQVWIQFPEQNKADPSATLTAITFHGCIDNPVRLSHEYAVRFAFDVDGSFKKLLPELGRPFPIFKTGQWKMKAVVGSVFTWGGLANDIRIERDYNIPRPELYGQFESLLMPFEVKPTSDEALSRQDILRAVHKAPPETKLVIISYYAKEALLSTVDLIVLMTEADPFLRGHIAELYSSLGHPLSALLFFEWTPREILLARDMEPFFRLVAPGEQITLANARDVEPTFRVFKKDHRIEPHGEVSFTAPQTEGVYKVAGNNPYNQRSPSGKAWGWFLVYQGESRERDR